MKLHKVVYPNPFIKRDSFFIRPSNTRLHAILNEIMYHFCEKRGFKMPYNVQPLRTQQEINDFLFCLRRNKNADQVRKIHDNKNMTKEKFAGFKCLTIYRSSAN